jgi:hypothetical protein
VLAALLLAGPARAADRIPVVATFSVIGDMLANVGGDRIDIKTIVETGGDCELYQPTAADVGTVALVRIQWDSNCFVRVMGSGEFLFINLQLRRCDLEKWLGRATAREKRPSETSPVERTEPKSIDRPAPVKTASYSDVKAAVKKQGRTPEPDLLKA